MHLFLTSLLGLKSLTFQEKKEIRKLFQDLGYNVILCEGEADVAIHKQQGALTVLTKDSDFFLMSNSNNILVPSQKNLYKMFDTNSFDCQIEKKYIGALVRNDYGRNLNLRDDTSLYLSRLSP
jgi:hypothetical protein